jgi:hypothetical protein
MAEQEGQGRELGTVAVAHRDVGREEVCVLCGSRYKLRGVSVSIEEVGAGCDSQGCIRSLGCICDVCVRLGPVWAAERGLRGAEVLREQADDLEVLAGRVAGIREDSWVTLQDLVAAELDVNLEAYVEARKEEMGSRVWAYRKALGEFDNL